MLSRGIPCLSRRVSIFFINRYGRVLIESVLLSVVAGVPHKTINTIGVWYTVSRVAYSLCYSYIESLGPSYLRSVAWWSGNISCITGLVLAGKRL